MSHNDRLIDLALAMAQDLREYADAASEAGDSIEATEILLAEFDALVKAMREAPVERDFLSQALNEGDGVYRP